MERGRFISIEGGEGCGKSTQCRRLAAALARRGLEVAVVREPGGTPLAEEIRRLLKDKRDEAPCDRAELMLFLAARAQLVEKTIGPALASGKWVVSDRFADSTLAYQGAGRRMNAAFIDTANDFACAGLNPDLTIVLDLPLETARKRLGLRNETADRIELAGEDFHARVRASFLDIARKNPSRVAVLDASQDADTVEEQILRTIDERLEGNRNGRMQGQT